MSETVLLENFVRLLATAFLLMAAAKIVLLSRETSWDGWNLMGISIAFLAINSVLVMFKQFGIYFGNVREILALASGLLAASSFFMSAMIIKKESKKGR